MTLVGLVVPGIPTVPCLLATSYFLSRSSPALNERLHRTRLFGPILREWDAYHGLSRSSKGKLIAVTVTIVVITLVLAPMTVVSLALIVLIASLSIYGVVRLPGLPEKPAGWPLQNGHARLALPAPAP
jgi:uncharacterized membrane protein YbaN (DUF454 family)